ncbi:ammonia-forming cytochrome c nitrite reductase subunit c552 [Amphritea sp. HPY]|uniref:ammonia-forming cytochrome c nitrite reductase subunit c552 n=1 Tax=Amphritea sp. HPY TaxID=3421652 RepID=UPI003D7C7303
MLAETGLRKSSGWGLGYLLISTLAGCLWASPVLAENQVADFLQQHWQRPLLPQGDRPEGYSDVEASLSPEACGTCHAEQLADWSSSMHSKAMGPGLMGQLVTMAPHARSEQQACLSCHAPLAEQADSLVDELKTGDGSGLHRQGLVCAACHVRRHKRFGPARKDGSVPAIDQKLPHDGWVVTNAFQDSRFCAACHQFDESGFALNGKLLENTYEEWRQSRYADAGVSCQQCHMPGRRHQWRGIHDPEMVRSGVSIEVTDITQAGTELRGQMAMTNTGIGHRFPTYVTPQVVMQGYQQSAAGELLPGTDSYFVVARRVALDLSAEIFDTRLAPDQTARLDYQLPRHPMAKMLVFRIWVEPDTFYQQFFTSRLQHAPPGPATDMLQSALQAAAESRFTLFEQRLALPYE